MGNATKNDRSEECELSGRALARSGVARATLHVGERERPHVGEFGDPFVGRPIPVRRLRLDSDQHGLVAPLRRLKRRGELERMTRDDAIVMIRGCDECCRIAGVRRHIV